MSPGASPSPEGCRSVATAKTTSKPNIEKAKRPVIISFGRSEGSMRERDGSQSCLGQCRSPERKKENRG